MRLALPSVTIAAVLATALAAEDVGVGFVERSSSVSNSGVVDHEEPSAEAHRMTGRRAQWHSSSNSKSSKSGSKSSKKSGSSWSGSGSSSSSSPDHHGHWQSSASSPDNSGHWQSSTTSSKDWQSPSHVSRSWDSPPSWSSKSSKKSGGSWKGSSSSSSSNNSWVSSKSAKWSKGSKGGKYAKGGHPGVGRADNIDVDDVRAEIAKLIYRSNRTLLPKFLRLGFHDCVGGCDGCIDMDNPDNAGLDLPIDAIYPIVERFREHGYSRADVWALATMVSAELALRKGNGGRDGYGRDGEYVEGLPRFALRRLGRKDCTDADRRGVGGRKVDMPSADLATHDLLEYFRKHFGFDADETACIMGAHAVATASRKNTGFGRLGSPEGWVFGAEEYKLDNRYYRTLMGRVDGDDDIAWDFELVENKNGIPDRHQWTYEREDGERLIMTNSDMALVHDFDGHLRVDEVGNEGAVDCVLGRPTVRQRRRAQAVCPVASATIGRMEEYADDNDLFVRDFEMVLEKMVNNGLGKR